MTTRTWSVRQAAVKPLYSEHMFGPPPVIVFAYARPDTLARTLACLRENQIPKLYVFCDGARSSSDIAATRDVRQLVRDIAWTDVTIVERSKNLGLGRSIRSGVTEVLEKHESVLVFEDDLICVPGTYRYLAAALEHYRDDPEVMSVTGWTHPRVTPSNVVDQPYFDGRAESLLWGTWRRAWRGMHHDALSLLAAARRHGIDPSSYGDDVLAMADVERKRNIWAVRWLALHILNGGLCLRPPRSLVDHIGLDHRASNAGGDDSWALGDLAPALEIPSWPLPIENPECVHLWQTAGAPRQRSTLWFARRLLQRVAVRARALW